MRYFTRHWYDTLQELARTSDISSPWSDRIVRLWSDLPKESYLAYLDTIRQYLDDTTRSLIASSPFQWHDARILGIRRWPKHLTILLEDQLARARYHRKVRITFNDTSKFSEPEGLEGQYVLYDEFFLHIDRSFEYSLLLDKTDFSVCCRSLAVDFQEGTSVVGGSGSRP